MDDTRSGRRALSRRGIFPWTGRQGNNAPINARNSNWISVSYLSGIDSRFRHFGLLESHVESLLCLHILCEFFPMSFVIFNSLFFNAFFIFFIGLSDEDV